MKFPEEIR